MKLNPCITNEACFVEFFWLDSGSRVVRRLWLRTPVLFLRIMS